MTLIFQLMGCSSILGVLALVIPFWFKAAKAHNKLLKFQYENALDAWRRSGEPRGMLGYRAPIQSKNILRRFLTSNPAFTMLTWIFFTAGWIKSFPQAQEFLKDLRCNTLAWNIGVISFVLYPFLLLSLFGYLFAIGFLK